MIPAENTVSTWKQYHTDFSFITNPTQHFLLEHREHRNMKVQGINNTERETIVKAKPL